jgi:hypothetical protein
LRRRWPPFVDLKSLTTMNTAGGLVGDKRGRLCLQNLVSIITPLGTWVTNLVDKLCRRLGLSWFWLPMAYT